ncbi:malectin domain-containing carbohydrate-binding protein [Tunturiibacter psychrotolerans]|uniref:malectin domain-containing carbohydrate-binding protein n=1 Tax=Tunturiibacter psychrotolerans TaxID=3069686 RepID=UPI003D237351
MVTVMLSGTGGISNVINTTGTPHDFTSYAGSGTCSAGRSNVDINGGGAAVLPFIADTDFSGGSTYAVSNTISTRGVTKPAPVAVYQDAREGTFTYTVPGFAAGSTHTVRLHFAELYFSTAGQREFDVAINGTPVLTNFDIVAAAGAQYKANVQQFTTTANSSDAESHLLMSQPGVGAVTALAFVLTLGDVHRFPRGKQVPSHLGLHTWIFFSHSHHCIVEALELSIQHRQ